MSQFAGGIKNLETSNQAHVDRRLKVACEQFHAWKHHMERNTHDEWFYIRCQNTNR